MKNTFKSALMAFLSLSCTHSFSNDFHNYAKNKTDNFYAAKSGKSISLNCGVDSKCIHSSELKIARVDAWSKKQAAHTKFLCQKYKDC